MMTRIKPRRPQITPQQAARHLRLCVIMALLNARPKPCFEPFALDPQRWREMAISLNEAAASLQRTADTTAQAAASINAVLRLAPHQVMTR